ncbi:MAG TPA: energy transducer TonB [Bacteriovoracaceae bacterium]|nr:energy transducer TonB [Bacteriovoracaceae bacterium]
MQNQFLPHFLIVLGLHLSLLFGGMTFLKQQETLSSLNISPNKLRLQIATQLKRSEPKPQVKKVVSAKKTPVEKKAPEPEVKPEENKKISDEVVQETIISSADTQAIEDIRSLYKAQLRSKIEENKYYPPISRRLGQQGTVVVAFTLLKDGHIIDVKVDSPCQYERLNASALEAVRKVKRFMPIPSELGESRMDIKVPLKFFTI